MLLILALATIGIGYGLWSKLLLINGVVNTGEMNASLSLEEIDESDSFNAICPTGGYTIDQDCDGDGELDDELEAEGKNVAECEAVLAADGMSLDVTVRNAYPSFNCFIKWDVTNTGSIPIHVYGPAYFIDDTFWDGAINTAELHVNGWPPPCYAWYTDYVQLEPGESTYCNLHIHPNQPIKMNSTYTFTVKVFARQWNEIVKPAWVP
jgi:hypothetical protein